MRHLKKKLLNREPRNEMINITDEEILAVELAALCHDLGKYWKIICQPDGHNFYNFFL